MAKQSELDPIAILRVMGIESPTAVTPVSGGADTALWRVEQDGQTYALRVFRPEQAGTWEKEQIVMKVAAEAGLPVPQVKAAGSWQERPALLLSWCPGRTLLQELQAHPGRIWSLGRAFGQMQARIHGVAVPAEYHPYQYDWISWAGPVDKGIQERLRSIELRPAALLHLDYHPLNVMSDGRQITAVLDWANAHVGDPRADFARSYTILRLDPSWPKTLAIRLFRLVLGWAWRQGYQSIAPFPLADMPLFYAWAGAAMMEDLSRRLGRPDGVRPHPLDGVRLWTEARKREAGL